MKMIVVLKSGKEFVTDEDLSEENAYKDLQILQENWSKISTLRLESRLFPVENIEYIYIKEND